MMKQLRTIFLVSFLFVSVSLGADLPKQLNVLFIAIDDLNTRLGCYGFDRITSPHIDQLALEGVRFDRAYCQYPSCGPSRTSLLTGLRPQTTGMINNRMSFRELAPDAVTLPQLFKKNGYFTGRVGKIFHQRVPLDIGTSGPDDPASWHEVVNPKGRDVDEKNLMTIYTHQLAITDTMGFLKAEGEDSEQTDGKVVDETIRMLERRKDEPFFIAAGLYRPHTPYIAPKKYFELYDLETTEVPYLPPGYRDTVPAGALSSTADWPNFGTTEDEARDCILAYDACISFADAQIGRLLVAVDRLGLCNNTIVVLWGDHGYHLGEHGLWRKNSLYEESARAPLIFRVPGVEASPSGSPRIVEFVDIFPTLADLAGLNPPSELEGVSLRPLLEDPKMAWSRPAFIETLYLDTPGYSVRTDRWRYVEWGRVGEAGFELYDQAFDPQEMHNLAEDKLYQDVCAQLSVLVNRNWPSR